MTRCRPKLVLAVGTARLARTCVRPLPARPMEQPDWPDYAPMSHTVNQWDIAGKCAGAVHTLAAQRRPSSGQSRPGGGRSQCASGKERACLAANATCPLRDTHVQPGAGPPPAEAEEGGPVARAARAHLPCSSRNAPHEPPGADPPPAAEDGEGVLVARAARAHSSRCNRDAPRRKSGMGTCSTQSRRAVRPIFGPSGAAPSPAVAGGAVVRAACGLAPLAAITARRARLTLGPPGACPLPSRRAGAVATTHT